MEKGTLIGAVPSTCIRTEKDSQATSVKPLIGVALFVVTVTKALQTTTGCFFFVECQTSFRWDERCGV